MTKRHRKESLISQLNELATIRSGLIISDLSNGDNLNGDNCGDSDDRLSQNGEKATSQHASDVFEILCIR